MFHFTHYDKILDLHFHIKKLPSPITRSCESTLAHEISFTHYKKILNLHFHIKLPSSITRKSYIYPHSLRENPKFTLPHKILPSPITRNYKKTLNVYTST